MNTNPNELDPRLEAFLTQTLKEAYPDDFPESETKPEKTAVLETVGEVKAALSTPSPSLSTPTPETETKPETLSWTLADFQKHLRSKAVLKKSVPTPIPAPTTETPTMTAVTTTKHPHSQERRNKISASLTGKTKSEQTREKMRQARLRYWEKRRSES